MASIDSAALDVPTAAEGAQAEAAVDPNGVACQMARLSYKTALGTKLAFTALVFAVSAAAAAALVYAIIKIAKDGVDLSAVVTGVSGVVASGGALFLIARMNAAGRAEQQALTKVGVFCGSGVAEEIRNS